jgi:hypothetical protein
MTKLDGLMFLGVMQDDLAEAPRRTRLAAGSRNSDLYEFEVSRSIKPGSRGYSLWSSVLV